MDNLFLNKLRPSQCVLRDNSVTNITPTYTALTNATNAEVAAIMISSSSTQTYMIGIGPVTPVDTIAFGCGTIITKHIPLWLYKGAKVWIKTLDGTTTVATGVLGVTFLS